MFNLDPFGIHQAQQALIDALKKQVNMPYSRSRTAPRDFIYSHTYEESVRTGRKRPVKRFIYVDRSRYDGAALRTLRATRGVGPSRNLKKAEL